MSYRPELFLTALKMFMDFPLMGIGVGGFPRQGAQFQYSHSDYMKTNGMENTHNYFLQILAEQGLIGFGLLALFLGVGLLLLRQNRQNTLFLIIVGIFIGNLYGHVLLISSFFFVFNALLCINAKPSSDIPIRPWLMIICFIVFPVLFGVGILTEWLTFKSRNPFKEQTLCRNTSAYEDGWTRGVIYKCSINLNQSYVFLTPSIDPI